MQIDDRRRETRGGSGCGDSGYDFRETAAVIEMPVRQEDVLDAREIDAESPRVVEPEVGIGADIEEHAVSQLPPAARDQYGETVTGAAKLIEHGLAVVP